MALSEEQRAEVRARVEALGPIPDEVLDCIFPLLYPELHTPGAEKRVHKAVEEQRAARGRAARRALVDAELAEFDREEEAARREASDDGPDG